MQCQCHADAERARQVPFLGLPTGWIDQRGKLRTSGKYETRSLSAIDFIVIHHSAVLEDTWADGIADYHIDKMGWPGIGYAFVVHWAGTVEWCHDLEVMSYHVASRNRQCVGVCLPGDFTNIHPRSLQLQSARVIVDWLRWVVPQAEVVGHREAALPKYATSCPGDTWPEWADQLR